MEQLSFAAAAMVVAVHRRAAAPAAAAGDVAVSGLDARARRIARPVHSSDHDRIKAQHHPVDRPTIEEFQVS
jgi:hypothetical protein